MLKRSDIKKPAAPAKAPEPAPVPKPAAAPAPAVDQAALAEIRRAVGQLASTTEKLAWGVAAMKPAAPVIAMEADVVRDDAGRMKALRVTIIRQE